jgi:hypothetical protein
MHTKIAIFLITMLTTLLLNTASAYWVPAHWNGGIWVPGHHVGYYNGYYRGYHSGWYRPYRYHRYYHRGWRW